MTTSITIAENSISIVQTVYIQCFKWFFGLDRGVARVTVGHTGPSPTDWYYLSFEYMFFKLTGFVLTRTVYSDRPFVPRLNHPQIKN
jgi:hypothetical protein